MGGKGWVGDCGGGGCLCSSSLYDDSVWRRLKDRRLVVSGTTGVLIGGAVASMDGKGEVGLKGSMAGGGGRVEAFSCPGR